MTKTKNALIPGDVSSSIRPDGFPVTVTYDLRLTQKRCAKKAVIVGKSNSSERAAPRPSRFIPVTSR